MVLWAISVRNGLANSTKPDINGKWGASRNPIISVRSKLYENVIATIKGSANNEDTTLIKIVQLRSKCLHLDQNNPQSLAEANRQFDQMKSAVINIKCRSLSYDSNYTSFSGFPGTDRRNGKQGCRGYKGLESGNY